MTKDAIAIGRSKYWWLWPNVYSEKDARDGARMGVLASGVIAVMTGAAFSYRYATDGNVLGLRYNPILLMERIKAYPIESH